MTKKIELVVGRWGYELTMEEFTPIQYKKITEFALKNDINVEEVFLQHIGEVLDTGNDWYDFDSLGHYYGASSPDCTLKVFNEKRELLEEYNVDDIEYNEVISKIEEDMNNILVTYVSSEKGNLKTFELELKDNEEFDIKNLKLEVNVILTPNNVYELVNEATYNGKPLDSDGGDTTGKGLDWEIKLPLSIIAEEKQLVISALKKITTQKQ